MDQRKLSDAQSINRRRSSGFSLLELLVATGIVSTLAAIAISQFAGQKKSSIDSTMHSILRNARAATEGYYVENGGTYHGLTKDKLLQHGLRVGGPVDVVVVDADPTAYRLRACAEGGTARSFVFDSELGTATPDTKACS